MKKIFIISLFLAFAANTFSQVDTITSHTSLKLGYLKKSKTQKTVAWVLVGTGTTLMVVGLSTGLHAANDVSFNEAATGGGLIIGGAILDLGSTPLFIAGAKNKRKAMSVTINNDFVPSLRQGAIAHIPMPTVSLVLKL
jgi:hypothetical protein